MTADRDPEQHDDGLPTKEFGRMLEGALPKLKHFVRLNSGPVIRARESETDIAQSVCREAVVDRQHFRYGGADGMNQWLFLRAKQKIQDRVRYHTAKKRDVARETPIHGTLDPDSGSSPAAMHPADSVTPDRVAIDRERDARLLDAIASLPEDYREVLTLARLEELPHAEIARRLGRTEVATRKLLHRAIARLTRSVRE